MSFNTVKSKIILISAIMLLTISILLGFFAYIYLQNGKVLLLKSFSYHIENFAEKINKDVIKIENNAQDLALQGELFYQIDKNKDMALFTTKNIFKNYPISLGGGIWFEPYSVFPQNKLFCIYVYRNKDNVIVPDKEFESEEYNYPNKSWYKEIKSGLSKDDNVAWSLPYYEKEGSNTLMVTAGSGIYSNGKLVGISTVDWEINSIIKSISDMKPTPNSFAMLGDKEHNSIIVSNDPYVDNASLLGKPLQTLEWYNENLINITYFDYHGKKYIPYVKNLENETVLIICIPKYELFKYLVEHVIILFGIFMAIGLIISILLYIGLKKYIDAPIEKLTDIAHKIGEGELNTEIKLEKPLEFANLAKTFNKMAKDIKNITKDRQRIESELSLAKEIQASSLPNVFPPFPDKSEFDIFAGMEPAKEVGGDFYDFYLIDDDNFMFLIADVSGKGVPAALFMMTTKTLINYIAKSGLPPQKMIETINQKICENNKQGFFITMLAGIVNIKTGKINFVNCGHNPPLIKQNGGAYKYLELESNLVLGVFDKAEYSVQEMQLNKGDTIFLYTDGITEAVNESDEQYGEEKLLKTLNSIDADSIRLTLYGIKTDVKQFAHGVAHSDDMTMLMFKYNGEQNNNFKKYSGIASRNNFDNFANWLETSSTELSLSQELSGKLRLIAEELYTNIFSYAYPEKQGEIGVSIQKRDDIVIYTFSDSGTPYNPLEHKDPDVTLPPESREQGGLGIFIVKNSVDGINYEYKDGKNVLTMIINL